MLRQMDDLFDIFFKSPSNGVLTARRELPRPSATRFPDRLEYRFALPGVDPARISVSIADHQLLVAVTDEKHENDSADEEPKNLVPVDAWGTSDNAEFRIRLPEDADPAQPSAESKFGVLTVTVPLVVPEAPRQVEVKVAA